MKMILKIARNELRNLFYSPVAWFLSIAFMVQCAVFYTGMMDMLSRWQDMAVRNNPKFRGFGNSITKAVFLNGDGIFANVLQNLFLYVPLLTMGLISREINNGTIRLLYSSPVKVREIIWGKYLAIMFYNLVLVSILGIFMVSAAFHVQSIDYGLLFSAALGFYLMTCAFTAIGIFLSSLTTYQIVSAIGSFVVLFILGRIGDLWQRIDFVRDLTYFLSLQGRTVKMLKGLITTKDVIYFVLVVYMFLAFTYLRLKGGRESRPWYIKTGQYLTVFASVLLIGYISSRQRLIGYWDTTAGNDNTIHERTQKIVKELGDDPLEVTLYTNLLGGAAGSGFPEGRNNYLSALWEQYARFKPDIEYNYVYYYDYDSTSDNSSLYRQFPGKSLKQIAEQVAGVYELNPSMFETPEEFRRKPELRPESQRVFLQVTYKGRSTFLRTFDDDLFWPDEQQVAAAFKRLLQSQLPKVYYIIGNLERSIYKRGEREYFRHSIDKLSRFSLINQGFDADTVSLDTHEIPADAAIVVLADPKTTLSATTQRKIQEYVDKGGNLLVLGEPGKQAMLNPVLQPWGVQLMNGTLVEPTKDEMPNMVKPYLTDAALDMAEEWMFLGMKKRHALHDYDDSLNWLMPGVTALSYTPGGPFMVTPLLLTVGQRSWLKAGPLVVDSADVVYSPQDGDSKGAATIMTGTMTGTISFGNGAMTVPLDGQVVRLGGQIVTVKKAGRRVTDSARIADSARSADSAGVAHRSQAADRKGFPTVLALTREVNGKEQRIIVCGDADWMSTLRIGPAALYRSMFSWLDYNKFPIYTPRPGPKDDKVLIRPGTAKVLNIVYVWILPGLVLLMGTVLLIRRKRK
jgi:ABC-2 type transport system permease protein